MSTSRKVFNVLGTLTVVLIFITMIIISAAKDQPSMALLAIIAAIALIIGIFIEQSRIKSEENRDLDISQVWFNRVMPLLLIIFGIIGLIGLILYFFGFWIVFLIVIICAGPVWLISVLK